MNTHTLISCTWTPSPFPKEIWVIHTLGPCGNLCSGQEVTSPGHATLPLCRQHYQSEASCDISVSEKMNTECYLVPARLGHLCPSSVPWWAETHPRAAFLFPFSFLSGSLSDLSLSSASCFNNVTLTVAPLFPLYPGGSSLAIVALSNTSSPPQPQSNKRPTPDQSTSTFPWTGLQSRAGPEYQSG